MVYHFYQKHVDLKITICSTKRLTEHTHPNVDSGLRLSDEAPSGHFSLLCFFPAFHFLLH